MSPLGRLALCLLSLLWLSSEVLARGIVDSAGRAIEVPERIERVFAAGPPASTLLRQRQDALRA